MESKPTKLTVSRLSKLQKIISGHWGPGQTVFLKDYKYKEIMLIWCLHPQTISISSNL